MAPIFVLIVVVFIHELGHFVVARWCGVNVSVFSIGFGREIAGFTDKKGTRWKFGWIPLGGYVKFMDDENAASAPSREKLEQMTEGQRAGAFQLKPLWQRAAVVAAGPVANFLSAIVMFAAVAYFMGTVTLPAQIEVLRDDPASPAITAGLKTGDVVTKVDGRAITDFQTLSELIAKAPGQEMTFEVMREGAGLEIKIVPQQKTIEDGFGGKITRGIVGVRPGADRSKLPVKYPGPGAALLSGVDQTWTVVTSTLGYMNDVFHGKQSGDKIGGLPTIIDVSNQMAKYGVGPLVQLIGLLSVSIGLLNLFPIPLLDGGHLMYYAAEAVMGRPLSNQTQEFGFRIGLALVSSLMVFALWNDRFRILKWFS